MQIKTMVKNGQTEFNVRQDVQFVNGNLIIYLDANELKAILGVKICQTTN